MSLSPLCPEEVASNEDHLRNIQRVPIKRMYQIGDRAYVVGQQLTKAIRLNLNDKQRVVAVKENEQIEIQNNVRYVGKSGILDYKDGKFHFVALWKSYIIKLTASDKDAKHVTVKDNTQQFLDNEGYTHIEIFTFKPFHTSERHIDDIPELLVTHACAADVIVYQLPPQKKNKTYYVAFWRHSRFGCIHCPNESFKTAAEWASHSNVQLNFTDPNWYRVVMSEKKPRVDLSSPWSFPKDDRTAISILKPKHFFAGSLNDKSYNTKILRRKLLLAIQHKHSKGMHERLKRNDNITTDTLQSFIRDMVHETRARWNEEARVRETKKERVVVDRDGNRKVEWVTMTREEVLYRIATYKEIRRNDNDYVRRNGIPLTYQGETIKWERVDVSPGTSIVELYKKFGNGKRLYYRNTEGVVFLHPLNRQTRLFDIGITSSEVKLGFGQGDARFIRSKDSKERMDSKRPRIGYIS